MSEMEQPTRELTDAEKRRYKNFCAKEDELKGEGYTRHNLTISILEANLLGSLIALLPCIPLAAIYYFKNGFSETPTHPAIFATYVIVFFVLIVVHEGIHGLFWSFYSDHGIKDIEFGFIVKSLTPYCTCSSPLKKHHYIIGTFMPMFLLGICVMIVSIFISNPMLLGLGALNTLAGAGDILVICKLLAFNTKGKDVVLIDHPYDCGLVVFER